MKKEQLKEILKEELDLEKFKKTTTSLNNVFVGSMTFLLITVIGTLLYVYGFGFIVAALLYIASCYTGKYLIQYYNWFKEEKV